MKEGDILEGIININKTKNGYLTNETLNKDLFIFKNNLNTALNLDKVKVVVVEGIRGGYEGEVIEVLERNTEQFVGKVEKHKNKTFVYPTNKNINVKFVLTQEDSNKVEDEQIVVVKIAKWTNPNKNPAGELIKILGQAGEHETEIHSILEEFNLPYEFPQEVLNEAELISEVITQKEIDKRLDYRNILTYTIDGYDTKDIDDALSIREVDGNVEIGIHIADVSHYIKPNTKIDEYIKKTCTSIYLVDRVLAMMPKKLSNDLCSLNPNTDKLTFSFIFTFDKDGKIINQEFKKAIINSKYKLTYDEVQVIIEGGEARDEELKKSILILDKYAKILRKNRFKNDTLNFGTSEVKFKLDEKNKPVEIFFKEQKDANWLIEEFMILTNKRVCEFIASKGLKSIHRTHDKPDVEKLNSLKSFVESMGYSLNLKDEENIKSELNNLLKQTSKTPEENIINNLVVRCMAKANYQTLNVGHYGLGLKHYVHTTSGIRRICDLLIHRQLDEIIYKNKTDIKGFYEELDTISSHMSSREKIAQKAERESVKYMQALYLSDKIGKIYKGIVSSITDYGMFIDIPENGCNGFIKLSNIEGDRYTADVQNYCIKGSFGQSIRLGDEVNVVVSAVDVASKFINLSLVNL